MKTARTFRDLIVWQKAHSFVLSVYRLTKSFPREELYGLTSQLRRSSVSMPANIAEGFCRKSAPEKIRFLNIAHASLEESRYYLILAEDLDYAPTDLLNDGLEEISKLLFAYTRSLQKKVP